MTKLAAALALLLMGSAHGAEQFLDASELAQLTPHPDVEGVTRHMTDGVNLDKYDKRIIGNVTFYFSEKSKVKEIDPEEFQKIAATMKDALAAAGKNGKVVQTPSEGAVIINVAITEINMQNKKRGLLSYTPMGLVTSTVGNLAGIRVQLKEATIEGEVIDSITGEVVSVFRVDKIGNFDDKKGLSWEDLRSMLEDTMSKVVIALGR